MTAEWRQGIRTLAIDTDVYANLIVRNGLFMSSQTIFKMRVSSLKFLNGSLQLTCEPLDLAEGSTVAGVEIVSGSWKKTIEMDSERFNVPVTYTATIELALDVCP